MDQKRVAYFALASMFVLAMLVLLSGCGKKDDLQGTVTNKTIKPGYTYVYMMPQYTQMCTGAGTANSPRTCTQIQTGAIPITYTVPDCHQITVEGEHSGSTCIHTEEWDAIQIGDDYVGKDVNPKDQQKVVHH